METVQAGALFMALAPVLAAFGHGRGRFTGAAPHRRRRQLAAAAAAAPRVASFTRFTSHIAASTTSVARKLIAGSCWLSTVVNRRVGVQEGTGLLLNQY